MDEHFIKSSGMVVLGLLSAVIGLLILILLVPSLRIAGGGALISGFMFLIIWLVVYIGLVVAAMVVYFFKSVEEGSPAKQAARAQPRKAKRKRRR